MRSVAISLSNSFTGALLVSENLRDFDNIWPTTDRVHGSQCYAFQCADFLNVWCNTIGRARRTSTLFVAVMDSHGSPLALLPLGIERRFGIRILGFLDGGVADYNCPVLFPGSGQLENAETRKMWHALASISHGFDVVVLEKMPGFMQELKNPLVTPATHRFPSSGYFTSLQSNWDEFARRIPYAQDSRRNLRRLSEFGKVEFEIASTPEDRKRFLAAMMAQKSRRYIQTRGLDSFERPGYRDFFKESTQNFAERGMLHLSALTLDGKELAVHWGYVVGRRFYYLMPSYDFEWHRYSPGRLLLHMLLEWATKNDLAVFDQGIGDEEYKSRYCDGIIHLYEERLALTYQGAASVAIQNAGRTLKESALGRHLRNTRLLFRRAVARTQGRQRQ